MQQPNLFSPPAPVRPAVSESTDQVENRKPQPRSRLTRLLLATEFLLAVIVRIFIGVILLVLPWSPIWDNNHLLDETPRLLHLLSYGAVRGIFSGVGLLNLWIAVDDTLHRTQH